MNAMDLKTRAEQWRYYHRTGPTSASHDVTLFLDRLEQIERDLADELDEANARRADLRTALEWANEERDEARASVADAYRRGAEAMREAAAQWIPHLLCTVDCDPEESMRALPIPEEP